MTAEPRIEDYLRKLSRALSALAETDRQDILKEIGAHLEHRAGEGKLDDALKALGTPQNCARSFIDELRLQAAFTDSGPAKTFGALLALASRRITATAGLFVSGIFFLLSTGFALCAVMEIVSPEATGLWIDPSTDTFSFGITDLTEPMTAREVLGPWMFPVAAAFALFTFVIGSRLGGLFIRLMIDRGRAGAV